MGRCPPWSASRPKPVQGHSPWNPSVGWCGGTGGCKAPLRVSGRNPDLPFRGRRFVIEQNTVRRALHVLVLPLPQAPQERRQPACPKHQADRQQQQDHPHRPSPLPSPWAARKLFAITSSDELDIAAAASHGVIQPATANGTITAL